MPAIDFRQVRAMVSMKEVLDLLGFVAVVRHGNQLRVACPLHEPTTPTSRVFSVNLAKNNFQCFKCKAAGNQLDLWAKATKQHVYEAALDLCTRLNREVPWLKAEQRRGTRKEPAAMDSPDCSAIEDASSG